MFGNGSTDMSSKLDFTGTANFHINDMFTKFFSSIFFVDGVSFRHEVHGQSSNWDCPLEVAHAIVAIAGKRTMVPWAD